MLVLLLGMAVLGFTAAAGGAAAAGGGAAADDPAAGGGAALVGAAAGRAAATGGAAAVLAASMRSLGPGWAPSQPGGASSVPAPPAAPPGVDVDMSSPAVQAVFAVGCGALGLLFALLGQRVWRAFLALSALFAGGGLVFYLLAHNVAALPLWADGAIAGCAGALAAFLAIFFSLLGLLACSAAAYLHALI